MTKKWICNIFFGVCVLLLSNVSSAAEKYQAAPIDKILQKNFFSGEKAQKYAAGIVNSYTLYPQQLNDILQQEYQTINAETLRMQKIKQQWSQMPAVYRMANYKLTEQISTDIAQSRKKYLGRKNKFAEFIKQAPRSRQVYIIESTDPSFFFISMKNNSDFRQKSGFYLSSSAHGIHYLSLFDNEYNHVFTYHRQHVNMIKNRRFVVANTRNQRVNREYQQIFDDYITDLQRIGSGLDINSRLLLQKLSEMKNEYRSE